MLTPSELSAWLDEASDLLGVRRPIVLRCGSGKGWADRNGVALGEAVFGGGSGWREVVAHELAHAAQFRNGLGSGAPCSNVLALEEEAGWAAAEVLRGASARPRLAAHPALRLHWNRFGHFYTVQFMAVAMGISSPLAQTIALNAQIPDLVLELDAPTQSVIAMAMRRYRNVANPARREALIRKYAAGMPIMGTPDVGQIPPDTAQCLRMNFGLHCLTGGPCPSERRKRFQISQRLAVTPAAAAFGVSLHALGDAYAHTPDAKTMYTTVRGHSLDPYWTGFAGITNFGHGADDTSAYFDVKYKPYIESLYAIFALIAEADSSKAMPFTAPGAGGAAGTIESVLTRIGKIRNNHSEETQIAEIMKVTQAMHKDKFGAVLVDLAPDEDGFPLAKLPGKYGKIDLDLIRGLADQWSDGKGHEAEIDDSLRIASTVLNYAPDQADAAPLSVP